MVLVPLFDLIDGILAVVTFIDFALVALLSFPLIILLESTLIRSRNPGTKSLRASVVMNISTFLVGLGLGYITEQIYYTWFHNLPEGSLIFVMFLTTFILTILVEGGVFRFLEPGVPTDQIWKTTAIVNAVSYATLGLSIGIVYWGYDLIDSRSEGGGILMCAAPLLVIAVTAVLISEHIGTSKRMVKFITSLGTSKDKSGKTSIQVLPDREDVKTGAALEEFLIDPTPEPMTNIKPRKGTFWKSEWGTYTSWILLTTLGTTIGFAISGAAINKIQSFGGVTWSILLLGTLIGGVQWILLRHHVQRAGWWILATLGGWLVTLVVAARTSVLLDFTPDELVDESNIAVLAFGIIALSLVHGIMTGLFQWLVLRKQIQTSILWILISTFGWMASLITGSVVGLSLYYMLQQYASRFSSRVDINSTAIILWPVIIAGIVVGMVSSAITGTVYVKMHSSPTEAEIAETKSSK